VDLRRLLAQAGICAAEQKSRKAVAALALRGIAPSGEEHLGHCDGDYLEACVGVVCTLGVPAGFAKTPTIDLTEETLAEGAIRHDKFSVGMAARRAGTARPHACASLFTEVSRRLVPIRAPSRSRSYR
jgi:hypothetical protein